MEALGVALGSTRVTLRPARDAHQEAVAYQNQGDFEQAEKCYRDALRIAQKALGMNPDKSQVNRRLAQIYLNYGQFWKDLRDWIQAKDAYLKAQEYGDKALKLEPNDAKAQNLVKTITFQYTQFLHAQGETAQANQVLGNSILLTPSSSPPSSGVWAFFAPTSSWAPSRLTVPSYRIRNPAFDAHLSSLAPCSSPFFAQPLQPATSLAYVLPESTEAIQDTRHLAWCLRQSTASQEEKTAWMDQARHIIEQFSRMKVKNLMHVQEVVALAALNHPQLHRSLTNALLDSLKPEKNRLLRLPLLQGLSAMVLHRTNLTEDRHSTGDYVQLLQALLGSLEKIHADQNLEQARAVLDAIALLLDQMVYLQVKEIDRVGIEAPLKTALNRFVDQKKYPELAWPIQYIQQALARLPNDERFSEALVRRLLPILGGLSYLTAFGVKIASAEAFLSGFEPDKLWEAYQCFKDVFEIGNPRCASWYGELRFIDVLIGLGRLDLVGTLLEKDWEKREAPFLQGVCDRLERIACVQQDPSARDSALRLLKGFEADTWTQDVQRYARQTRHRLALIWPTPDIEAMARLDEAPAAWHPFWQSNPSNPILKAVQEKSRRHAYINQLQALTLHATMARHQPLVQLGDSVDRLKTAYLTTLKEIDTIKNALAHYIAPEGLESAHATERFTLMDKVEAFLQSDKKVLLLLGEAGSGKSTFGRYLARQLWKTIPPSTQEERPVPLFIALADCPPSGGDLVEHYLLDQKFKPETIDQLREQKQFILILDGFDEIKDRTQAFYTRNRLDRWNAQVIISSRPEYLEEGYRSQFQERGEFNTLQEYWLAPVSDDWVTRYIKMYCAQHPVADWDVDRYEAALNALPTLKEMIRRPFLLRMALEVLPILNTERQKTPLTRIALYDQFISLWWERSLERLQHIELNVEEEKALRKLKPHFSAKGLRTSQEMAIALTKAKTINAIYETENGQIQPEAWRPYLENPTEGARLLLFNTPLIRQNNHYRFLHKSIQDYLVARAICGPQFTHFDPHTRIEAVLNQLSLVDEALILDFLVERVKQHLAFEEHLHAWIEASKNPNAPVTVGAANAITILVRAGIQFNEMDLRGIRIPGADLSFGMFDSAQLQGADLRKVTLRASWLRQANLSGAQMAGVQFGEWAYLEEESAVRSCAYSSDGKNCAIGLQRGVIHVYDTLSWAKIRTLTGHASEVMSVVYSPSGEQIASGSKDKTVRLWDMQTGEPGPILAGHTGLVTSVVYSPSGEQIASGSDDRTVRLWDAKSGQAGHILQGHTNSVRSVVYSPSDGAQIASGSSDNTVRLWDAHDGKAGHILKGHTNWVQSVVYSPSGAQIASGSDDNTVRLWDAHDGKVGPILRGHADAIRSVVYSPSGAQIASGSDDKTVRLWDANSGKARHIPKGHTNIVYSVVYSPKGKQIASGSRDNTVRLWDAESGQAGPILQGHTNWVRSIVYSPDGEQIASGSHDKMVRLWDAKNGQAGHILQGHTYWVRSVVYSPGGEQIASGGYDKTVRLWDAKSGQAGHILQGHTESVMSVVYSPKGKQIASGSVDQTVRLWDAESGQAGPILKGHTHWVQSVAYSPKGKQIASGSSDKTVRLWDAHDGKAEHILEGHTNWVQSVTYSPSGEQIASGSLDNTVRLWDVASGECLNVIQEFSGGVFSVAWMELNGRQYLVTGSVDQSVRQWAIQKEPEGYQVKLLWSSKHDMLAVTDALFEGVQGLSEMNARLLKQRGAVDKREV